MGKRNCIFDITKKVLLVINNWNVAKVKLLFYKENTCRSYFI